MLGKILINGFLAIVWFVCAVVCARPLIAHAELHESPLEIVRDFQQPLTIETAVAFKDGGTLSIEGTDAKRRRLSFTLDGRAREQSIPDILLNRRSPRHVYVGATYPTDPKAVALDVGGADEKKLMQVLQAWIKSARSVPVDGAQGGSKEDQARRAENIRVVDAILDVLQKRDGSP